MKIRAGDGEAKPLLVLMVVLGGMWYLNHQAPLTTSGPLVLYGIGLLSVWGGIVAYQSLRQPLTAILAGFILHIGLLYVTIGVKW